MEAASSPCDVCVIRFAVVFSFLSLRAPLSGPHTDFFHPSLYLQVDVGYPKNHIILRCNFQRTSCQGMDFGYSFSLFFHLGPTIVMLGPLPFSLKLEGPWCELDSHLPHSSCAWPVVDTWWSLLSERMSVAGSIPLQGLPLESIHLQAILIACSCCPPSASS